MAIFTVEAVEQSASGSSDRGAWTRQKLTLNSDGTPIVASLFCNQYTPVPTVGSTLEGEIKPPKQDGWLPELVLPRKGGGGAPRPEDPKRSAAILRMHSQEMALRWMAIQVGRGSVADDFTYEGLTKVIDWFDADANQARDAA